MKIGMVGPVTPYRGGIAHFTTLLAKKLIEAGHELQVISFKKQYPAWLYPGESDRDYSPGRERVDAESVTRWIPYLAQAVARTSTAGDHSLVIDDLGTSISFSYHPPQTSRHPCGHADPQHLTPQRAFDRWLTPLEKKGPLYYLTEKEKGRLLGLLPEAGKSISPLCRSIIQQTRLSQEALRTNGFAG